MPDESREPLLQVCTALERRRAADWGGGSAAAGALGLRTYIAIQPAALKLGRCTCSLLLGARGHAQASPTAGGQGG